MSIGPDAPTPAQPTRLPSAAPSPAWYSQAWSNPVLRRAILGTAAAALVALCPFVPWAPVKAVCVAISTVASKVDFSVSFGGASAPHP